MALNMLTSNKKSKVKKPIKRKSIRFRNPSRFNQDPTKKDFESFIGKKVKFSVFQEKHDKNTSGGWIYGVLEKMPHMDDVYSVTTKDNTPRNREGGFFWFHIDNLIFAGYLLKSDSLPTIMAR